MTQYVRFTGYPGQLERFLESLTNSGYTIVDISRPYANRSNDKSRWYITLESD